MNPMRQGARQAMGGAMRHQLDISSSSAGQQSAAPVYKTEPHASADAVLVGVAGFEPATSSFRTKSASRLRYTPEMARCTGLEPVSLDRQSSCLTRCITAQRDRRAIRCARAIAAVDEIWCARRESNPHGFPPAPQAGASAIPPRARWWTVQGSNLRCAVAR